MICSVVAISPRWGKILVKVCVWEAASTSVMASSAAVRW